MNQESTSSDKTSSSFLVSLITVHGKKLILSICFLALVIGVLYAFLFHHTLSKEEDYLKAQDLFDRLSMEHNAPAKKALLDELEKILIQQPDLKSKYDAPIAQEFLNEELPEIAAPYMERNWKRTHLQLNPFCKNYAEATLLIAKEEYPKALEMTLTLKKELESQTESNSNEELEVLWAWNFLRLGMLYQNLENSNSELEVWKDLSNYLASKEIDPNHTLPFKKGIEQLNDIFKENQISLSDYIHYRQRIIKN
jgi:hypothetical protein